MTEIDPKHRPVFPELSEPVSEHRPCGDDLEYDHDFTVLQAMIADKQEVQYGDFVCAPEAVNWIEVEGLCRELLLRTRDIRILIVFVRCRVRADRSRGLRDGLLFLSQALTQWPQAIHPQLVVDGESDPAVRANALAALVDPTGLMQDVRELIIDTHGAARLSMRDVECSMLMPHPEGARDPQTIGHQLWALRAQHSPVLAALDEALIHAGTIEAWAREQLPLDYPDLRPLLSLLSVVAMPSPKMHAAPVHGQAPCSVLASVNAVDSAPMSRASARHMIHTARLWFEDNEPSSPVSLLLRQAERLTGKRFDELLQVIPADLVQQWAQDE
jgi:type VI secretion system protein ImpA